MSDLYATDDVGSDVILQMIDDDSENSDSNYPEDSLRYRAKKETTSLPDNYEVNIEISSSEFDDLCDELKKLAPIIVYTSFILFLILLNFKMSIIFSFFIVLWHVVSKDTQYKVKKLTFAFYGLAKGIFIGCVRTCVAIVIKKYKQQQQQQQQSEDVT